MSLLIKHFYRFGAFTLDTDQRVLFREGKPLSLTPKVFDTLLILVENRGRIVEKDELMNRLWPDTFVEESNLTFNIKQLRKLLGDDARQPVYIETVSKRGYRFIANVEELLTDDIAQIVQRFESSDSLEAVDRKTVETEAALDQKQPQIESAGDQDEVLAAARPDTTSTAVAPSENEESRNAGTATSEEISAATRADLTGLRRTSTTEQAGGKIRKRAVILFAGLSILLVAVALLFYVLNRSVTPTLVSGYFQNVKLKGLTNVGNAGAAAISPEGKFISYAVNDNGKYSLWTKAIATGSAVEIVPPGELEIMTTTFSPDGDYVYYVVRYKDFRTVLYRVPVLGGKPSQIRTDVGNDVSSFSPDGRQFTYVRYNPDLTETQLYVASTESDDERAIAARPSSQRFVDGPSWSPDGSIIAVGSSGSVFVVPLATGEVKPLTQEHWDLMGRIVWFKDGSGLCVVGRAKGENKLQIWHVAYPGGETRRITNDLTSYDLFSLNVTSNNKSLVTVQEQGTSSIWVVPDADAGRARQLIPRANSEDGVSGLAWTPDGRIVYTSLVSGHMNLWLTDREGNNPRQLTALAAADFAPCISPDGRYVVFVSSRSGGRDLWRVDIDGSNEKQLTDGARVSAPTFSRDGRWIVYSKTEEIVNRETDLWRVPVDGGSPSRLTYGRFAGYPAVSPDGNLIAFYKFDVQDRKTKIIIIPFDGGAPQKELAFTFDGMPWIRWAPDGRSLIYNVTNRGATNLWRLPIDGGPPQQITDFKSGRIWYFDGTRDGKYMALARGSLTTDVVLISSE
jgi:Tol biopolymer transport system component/DNA-binding winged helix-turn-helix (wHTH) protein